MKKIILMAAIAVSTLSLAACDSKKEEAAEDKADIVSEQGDATADAMEDKADTLDTTVDGVDSKAEQAMEDKAAVVRENAEKKADNIEAKAEATPQ